MACRVISRITDSVNCETLSLRRCLVGWDREEITSAIAGRLAQERNRFTLLERWILRGAALPTPRFRSFGLQPKGRQLCSLHSAQCLQRSDDLRGPLRNLLITP